jgi:DNA-binding NarL/FixJ family response regulator
MEKPLSILIVDDHPIFRDGLVKTIERHAIFSLAGQAADGIEALEKVRALHPDITVLDVEMPRMNGIEVARTIHKEALPTDMIFLTTYKDAAYFNAAMDLGVRGYMLKDSVASDFIRCLRTVAEGEYFISPSIAHLLIERKKKTRTLLHSIPALKLLTPAETNIVKLLAENLTNKQIAEKLFISIRTVENHRMHICQKLDIEGPHKLLKFAFEHKGEL